MNMNLKIILLNLLIGIVVMIIDFVAYGIYFEINENAYRKYIVENTKTRPTNTFSGSNGYYKYREFQIKKEKSYPVLVADNKEYKYKSINELVDSVNEYYLSRIIPGSSKDIIIYYKNADTDGSLTISWDEISKFQSKVMSDYKYRENKIVLKPNDFYTANGGDCDDFVSFTGGMLYYWGIDAYALIVENKSKGYSHAVLLVPADYFDIPQNYIYYDLTSSNIENIPRKRFIVIDYSEVGGFSVDLSNEFIFKKMYPVSQFIGMKY